MDLLDSDFNYRWHVLINKFHEHKKGTDWAFFMYEAKRLAEELPRIALWFKNEREGQMPKLHQQCSHQKAVPIEDNHLTCCLGVECRKCPFLLALKSDTLSPDEQDQVFSFTCATHILWQPSHTVDTSEGYIKTVGDQMFLDNLYNNPW